MATTGGPNIATDGLVFAFDTTNEKSFVGEPTENLISPSGINFTEMSTYGFIARNQVIDSASPSGYACEMEVVDNNQVNIHSRIRFGNANNIPTSGSVFITITAKFEEGPTSNIIPQVYTGYIWYNMLPLDGGSPYLTSEYRRFGVNVVVGTGSGGPNPGFSMTRNNSNVQTGQITRWHSPQVELKSHATPFVNGTRSSTESLLDQTKNNTLDVSYVSFDPTSKSKMVFDGTDDRMILPNLTFQSVELVMKINSTQGNGWRYLLDARSGWGGGYFANVSPGGWLDTHLNGELIDKNNWFNIVPKDEYFHFYLNAPSVITDDMNIMTRVSNNENLGGEIISLKLYDRKLTTEEIQQHYLSFKSKL